MFLHGSMFFLDVSGCGCHLFHLALNETFQYVCQKNVLRLCLWCVSLSSSLSVRNFYSSNSFSLHQSNHMIFLVLYHFSSLFILGKHFIFILHLADLLFLSFTFFSEFFAHSKVGFNSCIAFLVPSFQHFLSFPLILWSVCLGVSCSYGFPFCCHREIIIAIPYSTTIRSVVF